MRLKFLLATVAAAALTVAGAGGAFAGGPGHQRNVLYRFVGQLTATPGASSLSVSVQGGNRRALDAMLGQPQAQTFSVGAGTEFLRWSKGVPTVVTIAKLASGDYVAINVRAPRGSSLAQLEATAPGIVGDHGATLNPPNKPLYLYRGTLASAANGKVSLHVTGGNQRALRLLVGQSADESFSYADTTIFLLWQGRVPTVIDASKLVTGDKITIRIRANSHASLADVLATPANHIGDHEPATPTNA